MAESVCLCIVYLYVIVSDGTPVTGDTGVSDEKAAAAADNASSSGQATATSDASQTEQNLSSSTPRGTRRDIYAESSSSQQDQHGLQDVEPVATVAVDEIAYQKLRGSRETLYSKLKNRIRTLEDNLNLTNR